MGNNKQTTTIQQKMSKNKTMKPLTKEDEVLFDESINMPNDWDRGYRKGDVLSAVALLKSMIYNTKITSNPIVIGRMLSYVSLCFDIQEQGAVKGIVQSPDDTGASSEDRCLGKNPVSSQEFPAQNSKEAEEMSNEGVTCAVRDCKNLSNITGECKLNCIFITEEHKCRDYKKKKAGK
jgi:hypothetical protein